MDDWSLSSEGEEGEQNSYKMNEATTNLLRLETIMNFRN